MKLSPSKRDRAAKLIAEWKRMGMVMDKSEPVAAGICYASKGKVLLIKRGMATKDYPGHWSFPAGHIEAGESPYVAACRESYEEIAHFPENLREVSNGNSLVLFACQCDEFQPILNDESTGYVWASRDSLPVPLHPGVAEQIGAIAMDSAQN